MFQSKEFNKQLYQLMIEDSTNELIHNEKLKLYISMKSEVIFTACGLFNLDYTLLFSMISSATTYLVILIQFGHIENMDHQPLSTLMHNITYTNISTPIPISITS
ncbi:unnamed protein product [Nezara viridula]|uniref:Uncharacterized protein n=1 Tax=Nezara viridula TaxID=85310 RepID=A0A9P0H4J4_NEZVI|nr:unnamed protein product [Nezara viridula]